MHGIFRSTLFVILILTIMGGLSKADISRIDPLILGLDLYQARYLPIQ